MNARRTSRPATVAVAAVMTTCAWATAALGGTAGAAAGSDLSVPERLWFAQGHTHPIVVHLPIGLLMAAAGAVALRVATRRVTVGMAYYCLLLGTGGAVVATLAGWAWAPQVKPGWDAFDVASPFFWHRWGGVAFTVAAVGVLGWATVQVRRPAGRQWPWQVAVLALAGGIGWVGHEGGELAYEDNAAKIIGIATGARQPKFQRREVDAPVDPAATVIAAAAAGGPASRPTAATTAGAAAGTVDFAAQVWPVLDAKCIYCHGPDKAKGEYRLDTRESAFKGGESGKPPILPGDARGSPLVKHLTGEDADAYELMPPKKEKKPLTPDELALVKRWIDEGATWNR